MLHDNSFSVNKCSFLPFIYRVFKQSPKRSAISAYLHWKRRVSQVHNISIPRRSQFHLKHKKIVLFLYRYLFIYFWRHYKNFFWILYFVYARSFTLFILVLSSRSARSAGALVNKHRFTWEAALAFVMILEIVARVLVYYLSLPEPENQQILNWN